MMSIRNLAALALSLIAASTARGQTVHLTEAPLVDSCYRIKLNLGLRGKITFVEGAKSQTIDHAASADHEYLERILEAKGATADKTARVYHIATASIGAQDRKLRPERTFMVAHRLKEQLITYSPKGALTLEEMELTEHFDTLAVPGLLPGKDVKVGDSWPVANNVVQDLCGFDALEKHDLAGTLQKLEGDLAHLTLEGTARGIDLGAQVSTLISKSKIVFDAKAKRITSLEWTQSDQRQQGPASPNLSADVVIKLTRTPIDMPSDLNNFALVAMPNGAPDAKLTNLAYRDPQGKFTMQHGREWQYIGERDGQRVLRLISARGDWVADASIMPWPGAKMDATGFAKLLEGAPGWQQDSESKVDENVRHAGGCGMVRVSASGKLEGVAAFRTSYYLTNKQGDQMVVTFIAAPNQVNNLESRDQILVDGIELK
jgi:hypothetical protein